MTNEHLKIMSIQERRISEDVWSMNKGKSNA